MKILLHGNAPWVLSGYGNQINLFSQLLAAAGHDVIISSSFGLWGAAVNAGGVQVLPAGLDEWGNDVLPQHYEHYQPDVLFALMDLWVLAPHVLQSLPLAVWTPIDHEPVPAQVAERLKITRWPVAMSKTGERLMRDVEPPGADPFYIPHGVDTKVYLPIDRDAARGKWQVDEDTFLAVMVAANKGYPTRKNFENVFKAWGKFIKTNPKARLHVHALPTAHHEGLDLSNMAKFYEIGGRNLSFPDIYKFRMGGYGPEALNNLYNAADVFLAPSRGEGFGIPVVEAQAAGCPVIVSDFSAQRELCFGGYKIAVGWADRIYTGQGAEYALPNASAILTGLEWALEHRGDDKLRDAAREGALPYDADVVFEKYLMPVFELIAEGSKHPSPGPSPSTERGERDASAAPVRDADKAGLVPTEAAETAVPV